MLGVNKAGAAVQRRDWEKVMTQWRPTSGKATGLVPVVCGLLVLHSFLPGVRQGPSELEVYNLLSD